MNQIVIVCESLTGNTAMLAEVLRSHLQAENVSVMTPAQAKLIGSDYIVVGRPITAAADPVAAYERCVAEFCD